MGKLYSQILEAHRGLYQWAQLGGAPKLKQVSLWGALG